MKIKIEIDRKQSLAPATQSWLAESNLFFSLASQDQVNDIIVNWCGCSELEYAFCASMSFQVKNAAVAIKDSGLSCPCSDTLHEASEFAYRTRLTKCEEPSPIHQDRKL